ncbi:gibberellin-regulated protein 1-like [Senna tora]|uniref:Gibberellin-regulated protein 1-like n=1 Tax=Senna tora TaxID=362788 RepID=A0A834TVZ7_9FABA|nr:gibberellin-regulated protein 1-like [Senna tora]
MALSKLLVASLLISLLLLHVVDADQTYGFEIQGSVTQGSLLQQIDCKGACGARCRLSSRPRLCQRACGTCCKRCNCVPPGTAGNQQVCPCYANMTTHGGRRKCP